MEIKKDGSNYVFTFDPEEIQRITLNEDTQTLLDAYEKMLISAEIDAYKDQLNSKEIEELKDNIEDECFHVELFLLFLQSQGLEVRRKNEK